MNIISVMHDQDALVALVIPQDFTSFIENKADEIADPALSDPDSVAGKIFICF